jgi:hypothetical protein
MKLLRLAACFAFLALPCAAQSGAGDQPARYARVTAPSARILNLKDASSTEVARPAPGTLLAVFRETDDFLEVETPGGFAVWVFGKYLSETGEPDVYRVNGDGVNLRPQPSRGLTNFPLGQQLYAGDQVRVIERADPALALADDWVRIWSPPGVRAWIVKASTEPLAAGEDGAGLWKAALASLPSAPARAEAARKSAPPAGKAGEAGTAPGSDGTANKTEAVAKFDAALEAAVTRMEDERVKPDPDWTAVRGLFADAERLAPSAAERAQVRLGLQTLAPLVEASALKLRLEGERARLAEAARAEQERVKAESREKDPLGGVFLVRGGLERVTEGAGDNATRRYFVRFGTGAIAEIICVSGRYDLDLFVGYQVGVRGTELRPAVDDGLRHIEVTRLEVIGRRS